MFSTVLSTACGYLVDGVSDYRGGMRRMDERGRGGPIYPGAMKCRERWRGGRYGVSPHACPLAGAGGNVDISGRMGIKGAGE